MIVIEARSWGVGRGHGMVKGWLGLGLGLGLGLSLTLTLGDMAW